MGEDDLTPNRGSRRVGQTGYQIGQRLSRLREHLAPDPVVVDFPRFRWGRFGPSPRDPEAVAPPFDRVDRRRLPQPAELDSDVVRSIRRRERPHEGVEPLVVRDQLFGTAQGLGHLHVGERRRPHRRPVDAATDEALDRGREAQRSLQHQLGRGSGRVACVHVAQMDLALVDLARPGHRPVGGVDHDDGVPVDRQGKSQGGALDSRSQNDDRGSSLSLHGGSLSQPTCRNQSSGGSARR